MNDHSTISSTPQSGDDCHECNGGKIVVYGGRDGKSMRVKYLWCDKCHAKPSPNTVYVPLQYVARRRRKS